MNTHPQPIILIVDDYPAGRYATSQTLKRAEFEVWEATTGQEALEKVLGHPDLIILDINLPDLNGMEVCRQIRQQPALSRLPILHLSVISVDAASQAEGLNQGADAYLVQPVAPQVLVATVRALLRAHRAERALRESEERYRAIVEDQTELVCRARPDGVLTFVNGVCGDYLGRAPGELLGQPIAALIGQTDPEGWGKLLAGFSPEQATATGEHRLTRAEGQRAWLQWNFRALFDQGGALREIQGVGRDITQYKQLEEERQRSYHLRTLVALSAGISHNLNNLLATMLLPATVLQGKLAESQMRELVQTIVASVEHAADLVHRLGVAVRGSQEEEVGPVPVGPTIQAAIATARPRWQDEAQQKGIAIQIGVAGGEVPPVRGTGAGLHSALVNMIFNAVEAMPRGGAISIRTRLEAGQVALEIQDSGIGMDEATCQRIFEPFFTTKQDVGSGLGLSTARGLVTQWGGKIEAESAPGQGATFTLRLPIWTGPSATGARAVEGHDQRASG